MVGGRNEASLPPLGSLTLNGNEGAASRALIAITNKFNVIAKTRLSQTVRKQRQAE